MERSPEELVNRNKFLLKQIKVLQQNIAELKNQNVLENTNCLRSSDEDDDMYEEYGNDDDLEPLSDLKKQLETTMELNDMKFISYSYRDLPSENGIKGQREVKIDVLIKNWLKAHIKFIENSLDSSTSASSLTWKVDGILQRSELAPLTGHIKNDLPSLYARLKEYAELAKNRSDLLQDFSNNFDQYFNIQQTDGGILLKWQDNLFQILWSLRYCEHTEEIINFFEINCHQKEREFTREAKRIFEELMDVNQTIEARQKSLKQLALCAIKFQNSSGLYSYS